MSSTIIVLVTMNLDSNMPCEVLWQDAKLTPFGSGSLMRGIPGDYYNTYDDFAIRSVKLDDHDINGGELIEN